MSVDRCIVEERTPRTFSREKLSSGLLRRVALVRTDVSEEPGASFIKVTKIGGLGTTQAATSNRRTLRRNTNTSRGSVVVKAVCYKPEGRGFETR
jgi:hypothetical protein